MKEEPGKETVTHDVLKDEEDDYDSMNLNQHKKQSKSDKEQPSHSKKRLRHEVCMNDDASYEMNDVKTKLKYDKELLFIGQLPYNATVENIKEHFGRYGVYDINALRLLSDKKTKKSRGIAFMELSDPKQTVLALRCHHTKIMGRLINVERTVGGGGTGAKRVAKLTNLREIQNKKVTKEVETKIMEMLALNPGTLISRNDFDDRAVETLGTFPRETLEDILTECMNSDRLEKVENRSAWFMGIIKKYRTQLKDGNDFGQKKLKARTGRKAGSNKGGSRRFKKPKTFYDDSC